LNGGTPKHRAEVLTCLVELYEAWQTAEPGKGYDARAAEWREKLAAWKATTQPTVSTQPSAVITQPRP
jgi:hypothetical protein